MLYPLGRGSVINCFSPGPPRLWRREPRKRWYSSSESRRRELRGRRRRLLHAHFSSGGRISSYQVWCRWWLLGVAAHHQTKNFTTRMTDCARQSSGALWRSCGRTYEGYRLLCRMLCWLTLPPTRTCCVSCVCGSTRWPARQPSYRAVSSGALLCPRFRILAGRNTAPFCSVE